MLRKTLQGSESEELEIAPSALPSLVPFGDVVGCLAIHIKNCRNFVQRPSSQHFIDLFICISVNNIVKSTKRRTLLSRDSERSTVIKFDEIKYFSVQVPRRQDDTRNNISLKIMQRSNTETNPVLLGSAEVHLYEVIQFICRLEVEFMFSYGNFGYGFSHQLKPLQKIIEPSMFMNIAPPPERRDPMTNVIIPRPVEYPAFLSPDLNVTVGVPPVSKESHQKPAVRLEKLEQQPGERLERMKKEYRNLGTWKEKVDYLENLLNPKLEPKESEVIENHETLLGDDNKEGLPTSTSSQLDQANSIPAIPESVTSTPPSSDTLLPSIPMQEKYVENKIRSSNEGQSEVKPEERKRSIPFLSDVKSDDRHRSILKTISSLSEVKLRSTCIKPETIRRRNLASSSRETRWQSNHLILAERKSTSLVSPDLKLKGSFQSQDLEDLELTYPHI
uniref:C2 domain-containing protein n=1 Tax=Sciurus vulgaris TaxID=55149 RepID=A0A8D2AYV3_SCIVU